VIYRGASTLRWFELPGVICAYQPVMAPDPIAARQNMGQGRLGVNTATPGVAPTWSAVTGWAFIRTILTYLTTGITVVPNSSWSFMVRYSSFVQHATLYQYLFGSYGGFTLYGIRLAPASAPGTTYFQGGSGSVATETNADVLGVAGLKGYRNGVQEATISANTNPAVLPFYIGAYNATGTPSGYITANIQGIAFYNRTLTATEVWQVSLQMKYCDQNDDWNVWKSQRRWFIFPQAAAAGAQIPTFGAKVWRRPGAVTDAPEVGSGHVVRR
jgi:hypothetical protein